MGQGRWQVEVEVVSVRGVVVLLPSALKTPTVPFRGRRRVGPSAVPGGSVRPLVRSRSVGRPLVRPLVRVGFYLRAMAHGRRTSCLLLRFAHDPYTETYISLTYA